MNPFLEVNDEAERRDELLEQRLRALGTRSPACSVPECREDDPFALTGAAPEIVCREHVADAAGQDHVEEHHVAGRHSDPVTVSLMANDHAAASAHQRVWPEATLRNRSGSPLRRAAAWIRGWLDLLRVIIDRHVGRIPAALERLDDLLAASTGSSWWESLGWDW